MMILKKVPFTLTTAGANFLTATATTASLSGYIVGIKVVSPPAVDNTATLATVIKDDDTDTIAIKAGYATQAVNTRLTQFNDLETAPNQLRRPVAGPLTITGTLSANQTVGRVVSGFLYIESFI